MSEFRIKKAKFWTDPRVARLFEISPYHGLIFDYAFTGVEANRPQSISGIFEIYSNSFMQYIKINDQKQLVDILVKFNEDGDLKSMMEYDFESHMVFIKKFFDYNFTCSKWTAKSLFQNYQETFEKAPKFWADFSENPRNKEHLRKLQLKTTNEEELKLLETLTDLKDTRDFASPSTRPKYYNKLQNNNKNLCKFNEKSY